MARSGKPVLVIDAARTPYGRRGGALAGWHPVDLAAELLGHVLSRAGIEPVQLEGVFFGCTSQLGAQAGNIARRAALAAGWPESLPGATVEAHVASSAQAVHLAAGMVASGTQDLLVAGGVEAMSTVPLGASLAQPVVGKPLGRRLAERYQGGRGLPPPGLVAEEVARRWSLGRADLDAWAVGSHRKASASQAGAPRYLVPVGGLDRDENLGHFPSRSAVRALVPAYLPGGVVTAANMASEGDGASAVVVASEATTRKLGLSPRARFVALASAGSEPAVWPAATVPATTLVLRKARLAIDDVDWWYVHESSSAAVLAWVAEMRVPAERVNPEGGALASMDPAGAAGAGLLAMAVQCLAEGRGRRALVAVAGEGGVGLACLLEQAG